MSVYQKIKYPILLLLLCGIFYSIYNYYTEDYFIYFKIKILSILILCVIVFFFLPRKLKSDVTAIPTIAILICIIILFLNINISIDSYKLRQEDQIFTEYWTRDCNVADKMFKKDLKNNSLKYFSFGMFYPTLLAKNLKKYDVDYFFQGCTSNGGYSCYNKLVEEYLFMKYKIKVNDLIFK